MQNAKKGRVLNSPLVGLKHTETITLSSGETFTKADLMKDPAKVMVSIIKQQRSLYAKEIRHFQQAKASAENPIYPMRSQLYDIYLDALDDPFIHGQIYNHRILPVKNKVIKVTDKDGKAAPDRAEFLRKSWMDNFITWALESKFLGHSLIGIKKFDFDGKTAFLKELELVDRKHVHPESHIVTVYETDLQGTDYTVEPVSDFYFPIGDDCDLGLLMKALPLWIIKKHGWQNWDEFGERFGIPIMTVKTASQDARVQAEIEQWMQELSTGAYGIFPQDVELDIKENNKTDAYMVFLEMIKAANEELAILFSGQTMTSMNGSSRSQGEVHERVKDEITKDDEKFILTLFNERLIPFLRDVHGYKFLDGDKVEWDTPEDLQALLKIFQGVNSMGFQIDPKQVTERFGVKIIGLKQTAGVTQQTEIDEDGKPKEKEDEELKAGDLIKLHARINELYGGSHVH